MQEVKIGLEIHVELDTETKLFCSCKTDADLPNSATCEICLGMPGSKPVVNKRAISYAIMLCKALNSKINRQLIFSRKSYFYPDMSKNYQITQYETPLGENGKLNIGKKEIRITRIHLEEDPASIIYIGSPESSPYVLVDYNRSGRALCEIVTKPDIESPEEARAFMKKLVTILRRLKIFDVKKCIIKADANVSIRESGYKRVEIKNITGFKEIERALKYEIERQKSEIIEGKDIEQQTRGWNHELGITYLLRKKEAEEDYGYIFEPDLVPIDTQKYLESIKLPELPDETKTRLIDIGVHEDDAEIISSDYVLINLFDELTKRGIEPLLAANWLRKEILRIANYNKIELDDLNIDINHLFELLEMVQKKEITVPVAKKIIEKFASESFSPREYIKKENLTAVSDVSKLREICEETIKENMNAVSDYKKGSEKALNFIIGAVMRKTRGTASPEDVKKILIELIK